MCSSIFKFGLKINNSIIKYQTYYICIAFKKQLNSVATGKNSWTDYNHDIMEFRLLCSYLVEKPPKMARRGAAKYKHLKSFTKKAPVKYWKVATYFGYPSLMFLHTLKCFKYSTLLSISPDKEKTQTQDVCHHITTHVIK